MERIILEKQNLTPTFIGAWAISPLSICDELIAYFESNKNKQKKGVAGSGINLNAKDSTDIRITPKDMKLRGNEIFEEYFQRLYLCYQDYVTEWPFLTTFAGNLQISSFNLQRYQSGQHFQNLLSISKGRLGCPPSRPARRGGRPGAGTRRGLQWDSSLSHRPCFR